MDSAAKHCLKQLWPGQDLEISPVMASGWSGMPIWRVDTKSESLSVLSSSGRNCEQENTYSIRGWPRCTESLSKIQYWAEVVDCYRNTTESCPFPAPVPWAWGQSDRYVVRGETLYWTLAPWRRGASLEQHQVDQAMRLSLVRWLASIHSTTQQIGKRIDTSKAMMERWSHFSSLMSQFSIDNFASQLQKSGIGEDRSSAYDKARMFQERLQRLDRRFRSHCEGLIRQSHELHWIVRDLWRENVLVDGEGCLSIVDLGAARVEWPLFDLIRLLGSLRAIETEWDECIQLYFQARGTKLPCSIDSLRLIHGVATSLSITYWLDQRNKLLPLSNAETSPGEPINPLNVVSAELKARAKSMTGRIDQRLEELFWEWDHCD